MEIVLQYFDGCPNWQTTFTRLGHAIEGIDAARIRLERIGTEDAAMKRGFHGSPTVLVDGVDPFADDRTPVGLACRIYHTESGLAGSPSLPQLCGAVDRAMGSLK